jgi:hypothetical protein
MADTAQNQETKPFRVTGVGAIYQKPAQTLGPDGKLTTVMAPTLGGRGEVIDLVPFEAERLQALGVVRPNDEPRSYDELSDEELEAATTERALDVRGSAADGSIRREDRINALLVGRHHDGAGRHRRGAAGHVGWPARPDGRSGADGSRSGFVLDGGARRVDQERAGGQGAHRGGGGGARAGRPGAGAGRPRRRAAGQRGRPAQDGRRAPRAAARRWRQPVDGRDRRPAGQRRACGAGAEHQP